MVKVGIGEDLFGDEKNSFFLVWSYCFYGIFYGSSKLIRY